MENKDPPEKIEKVAEKIEDMKENLITIDPKEKIEDPITIEIEPKAKKEDLIIIDLIELKVVKKEDLTPDLKVKREDLTPELKVKGEDLTTDLKVKIEDLIITTDPKAKEEEEVEEEEVPEAEVEKTEKPNKNKIIYLFFK